MAKNFFETIEDGKFEVDHCGEKVTLELPLWLRESAECLDDEEKLLHWAKTNEILHGLMHNGLQKLLIDLRAVARPQVKTFKQSGVKSGTAEWDEAWKRYQKEKAAVINPNDYHFMDNSMKITLKISKRFEQAQERVDSFVLSPGNRPGASKKAEKEKVELETIKRTIAGMKAAGLDDETIRTVLGGQFDKGLIDRAMEG